METQNKGFTLVEIMIVVVIIGLLAALAVPGWRKIRASSQDRICTNNARQLSAAAEQYFLDHGVSLVNFVDLVGTEDNKYIKVMDTVAEESYPSVFTMNVPVVVSNIGNDRTITYSQ